MSPLCEKLGSCLDFLCALAHLAPVACPAMENENDPLPQHCASRLVSTGRRRTASLPLRSTPRETRSRLIRTPLCKQLSKGSYPIDCRCKISSDAVGTRV